MAVILFMRVPELSPERYDEMMVELGLDPSPPAGLILHQASEGAGAINIAEIWQTEPTAESFVEHVLKAAVARHGVKEPLSYRIEPLHNLFAPGLDLVERIGLSSLPPSRADHVVAS